MKKCGFMHILSTGFARGLNKLFTGRVRRVGGGPGREPGGASVAGLLRPEAVAESGVGTRARDEFLILPHAKVLDYMRFKAGDVDRWLGGMRKLRAKYPGGI